MAWDATQQPWLVTYPDPKRNGTRVYEPVSTFPVYPFGAASPPVTFPDPKRNGPRVYEPSFVLPPSPISRVYETAYPEDWLVVDVQPGRTVVYAKGDTCSLISYFPIEFWLPEYPQPDRPIVRSHGTDLADGHFFQGVDSSSGKWEPIYVQPDRPIVRSHGTDLVDGHFFQGVDSSSGKWEPTYVQPDRKPIIPGGTSYADPGLSGLRMSDPGRWEPVYAHPDRTISRPRGTDLAWVSWDAPRIIPVDRWVPTYVQPDRPARKSDTFVAGPPTLPIFPSADQITPIVVQPGRPIVYAKGSFAFPPKILPDTQFAWRSSLNVQPNRATVRDLGTTWTGFRVISEIVLADKWQPTTVQPSRLVSRNPGTIGVSGDFHRPGDPDPQRGTSTSPGPDPSRGTSIRAEVTRI